MAKFLVECWEDVASTYLVEADSADQAAERLLDNPSTEGEQVDFYSFDMEVRSVRPEAA